jgi:hypothetical protein
MAPGSRGHQPGQETYLGFPLRPDGGGEAMEDSRHYWYELAQEIHGGFADIDQAMAGIQWSGDGRRAFYSRWSEFSGQGTEASRHSHKMRGHRRRWSVGAPPPECFCWRE